MLFPKIRVLRSHGRQAIPDLDTVELTPKFRGRPVLTAPCDDQTAEAVGRAAQRCPTGALSAQPFALDLGRCLFCGECARIAQSAIRFTNDYRIGSPVREGLVVRPGQERIPFDAAQVRPEIRRFFAEALQLREVSAMFRVTGPETTTPSAWRGEAVNPMPWRPRSKLTLPVAPSSISTEASPPA